MNLETFKKAGVCFSYCRFAVFPQIPYVQDVLYVLQLTDEKDAKNYYSPDGASNWSTYIENVMLVAAAVASRVLNMERYDEAAACKIIAQAILDLTAQKDRCLLNDALAEATETVTGRTANREVLLTTCGCTGCREIILDHKRSVALWRLAWLARDYNAP